MIAYLSLGSNLGDRQRHLHQALEELDATALVEIQRVSPAYETEPVGYKDQPDFLNMVAEVECRIPARELRDRIKDIEKKIGRTRSEKWGPREIDIDIIYFGSLIIDDDVLVVPHRERTARRFVLEPLAELAPSFTDPVLGISVQELLAACTDPCRVVRIPSSLSLPLEEH